MSGTLASLYVKLFGDSSHLDRTLSNVNASATKSGGILKSALGTGLGFIGANVVMQGFGMAVDFAGEALIGYNARMEQAQIGFTTMLGSADKAKTFIADLQQFAKVTPFDFPGLQKAANTMMAMGFTAEEILPTLTSVGDAVAALGLGSEAVGRATYALGQMRAAGRVNAQDMMQLTSLGIPAWKLLADAMGKTVPEVRALSEKGLIPAQKGIDAIVNGIKNSNMGGMMKAQANTFNGAMSTILDTTMQLVSKGLEPLFLTIRDLIVAFSQWVQTDQAKAFFGVIGKGVDVIMTVLKELLAVAGPLISMMMKGFQKLGEILGPVIEAFGFIFDVISSGDDVAQGLGETIGNLGEKFASLGTTIMDAVFSALESVLAAIPKFADTFFQMASGAVDAFIVAAPQLLAAVLGMIQHALDWVINTGVPMAGEALGQFAIKFMDWVGPAAIKLAEALPPLIGTVIGFIVRNAPVIAGKILEWAGALVRWVGENVVPRLLPALGALAGAILAWLGDMARKLIAGGVQMAKDFVASAMKWLGELPGQVAMMIRDLIAKVAGLAPRAIEGFKTMAVGMGKAFGNGIVGLIEGAINAVIRGINSIQIHIPGFDTPLGKIAAFHWNGMGLGYVNLPRFERGLWDVGPHPIAAVVDPHEMIVPREFAADLRANMSKGGLPFEGRRGASVVLQVVIERFYGTQDAMDEFERDLADSLRLQRIPPGIRATTNG